MARDFTAASSHTVNYGDIGDLGTNKITLACWVYPDSFTSAWGLINKRSGATSANAYSMGMGYTSTTRWELQLGNAANTAVGAAYYATRSEAAGAWYHVCMTYDGSLSAGSRCAIYIDGVSKAVTASTDANVTPGNAASDLVLARVNNTGSFYFDGRMAEAAVWDVALSAEEAAALADRAAPILVRPANLAFYAPLVRALHDVMTGTVGTSSAAVIEHPPMRYPGRTQEAIVAVAGGVTVNAPSTDIAVAAVAPAVNTGKTIAVPAVNVAVAASAPAVNAGKTVTVPAVDIAIETQAPSVTAGSSVGASVDVPAVDIAVAAQAPTVAAGKTIAVPTVDISSAALAPSVQASDGVQSTIGSGAGWNIDFTGIETRISEERADREDRRRSIQNIFRRATGQPLPDDKPAEAVAAEMLSAVKPAARKRMQTEIKAIAEINQALVRLDKQIEDADMDYIMAEERDIVWIVSEYV